MQRFAENETGAISTEFVTWLPFLFGLLGMVFDVSVTLFAINRTWDVARDTARHAAIEATDPNEAAAYADANLPHFGQVSYQVSVGDSGTDDVTVQITMSGAKIGFFGFFMIYPLPDLNAVYTMRKEY